MNDAERRLQDAVTEATRPDGVIPIDPRTQRPLVPPVKTQMTGDAFMDAEKARREHGLAQFPARQPGDAVTATRMREALQALLVKAAAAAEHAAVIAAPLDGGAPEEGLLPMAAQLAQQHVVVVASVRDPMLGTMQKERATATQVFRAAAAERALLEREAVAMQLRQVGVEVVDAEPHQLPPALADAYIRLKAAGRL